MNPSSLSFIKAMNHNIANLSPLFNRKNTLGISSHYRFWKQPPGTHTKSKKSVTLYAWYFFSEDTHFSPLLVGYMQ